MFVFQEIAVTKVKGGSLFGRGAILLWLVLFVPQVGFSLFYSVIFFYSFLLLFLNKNIRIKEFSFYMIVVVFLLVISLIFIKTIIWGNLYDVKEFLKIVLFVAVYVAAKKLPLEIFERIIGIYLAIDLVVSLCQFMHVDMALLDFIISIYNSDNHKILLESVSVRALGLSPGPGTHGVVSLLFVWFFSVLFVFDKNTTCRFFGILFAVTTLFLSQSKTCILALIISAFVFTFFVILHKQYYYKILLAVIVFLGSGLVVCFFEKIISTFSGLNSLYTVGLKTSSMLSRVDNWYEIYESVLNASPIFVMFGAGRSYLFYHNIHNRYFDNDYLYVFVCYGLVCFVILLIFLLCYLLHGMVYFNRKIIIEKIIYMIVLSGSIAASSISFFTDLQLIAMLGILFAIKANENYVSLERKMGSGIV